MATNVVPQKQLEAEVTLSFPPIGASRKTGRVALITLNRPSKLNALTQDHFFRIAELLHHIDALPDVVVTVVTGTDRFFSSGADVTVPRDPEGSEYSPRKHWAGSFVMNNLHNTHAWYSHSKILVVALNGPAVGLSAAYVAHADFVYAAPHAYFATPFTSLGLVAEGGSSRAVVEKLGWAKASQALLQSRKVTCEELVAVGFVTKVFGEGGGDKTNGKGIDTGKFLEKVLEEVDDKLGDHLVKESILKIKKQMKKHLYPMLDRGNLEEIWDGLDVFLKGVPQAEFKKIASGEKRHKL